jgi:hypothetical protein
MATPRSRQRWWISLADLTLLIACIMVPLARSGGGRAAGTQWAQSEIPLAALFVDGEAMLSAKGKRRLAKVDTGAHYRISVGIDHSGGARLDQWELAAARTAALARALRTAGVAEDRIMLAAPTAKTGPAARAMIEVAR